MDTTVMTLFEEFSIHKVFSVTHAGSERVNHLGARIACDLLAEYITDFGEGRNWSGQRHGL